MNSSDSTPGPVTGHSTQDAARRAMLLFGGILVATCTLIGYLVWSGYSKAEAGAFRTAENLALLISDRLESTLRRADSELIALSTSIPPMALHGDAVALYASNIENHLGAGLDQFPEVARRSAFSADGELLYRSGRGHRSANVSTRAWFRESRVSTTTQLIVSEVFRARDTNQWTAVLARAIRDQNGTFHGAVTAALDVEALERLTLSLDVGDQGFVIVRRSDDNRLVLSRPSRPERRNKPSPNPSYDRLLKGETSGSMLTASPFDGVERAAAFRAVQGFPLFVVIGLARSDYLASERRFAVLVSAAALLLLASLGKLMLGRVRAERRLAESASTLAASRDALDQGQQLLRDVIDSTSEGILVCDNDDARLAINGRLIEMWNIPAPLQDTTDGIALRRHIRDQLLDTEGFPQRMSAASMAHRQFTTLELRDGRMIECRTNTLLREGSAGGFLSSFRDVTRLRTKELIFGAVIESSPDALIAIDEHCSVVEWSTRAEQLFGWPRVEIIGMDLRVLVPPSLRDEFSAQFNRYADAKITGRNHLLRQRAMRRDGTEFPVEIQVGIVSLGSLWRLTAFVRDLTDRLAAEEHLAQSRKLEAIGHLTGGLAHDFSNLLGIVVGSLDLLGEQAGDTSSRELLSTARSAAQRGVDVTKSLLAVARRQQLVPQPIDINQVVNELAPLLRQTAGKRIDMEVELLAGEAIAHLDAGGLNNALVNLVLNARDAMPDGGLLRVQVREIEINARSPIRELAPGRYLVLTVEDDGIGMTPDVAARAFDPFFTTKPRGKGTGLGLAMVYGFARQSGGIARLSGGKDHGTAVQLLLPALSRITAANDGPEDPGPSSTPGGTETILLVDDEVPLLRISCAWLQSLGYPSWPTPPSYCKRVSPAPSKLPRALLPERSTTCPSPMPATWCVLWCRHPSATTNCDGTCANAWRSPPADRRC